MGIENLRENKFIRKINEKSVDFLSNYIDSYNCSQKQKDQFLIAIKDSANMDSFYTAFLFTFSAFLFNKLKKDQAIVISSILYLSEIIVHNKKVKVKTKIKERIKFFSDLIESIILENEDMNSEVKLKIIKSVKQIIQNDETFTIPEKTFKNKENLNLNLRKNFIEPISLILSLGEIFKPRSSEELKYLEGYCINISKLIFIVSANENDKGKKISKYFSENEMLLFAQQADDFLIKFEAEKIRFLTQFTTKLKHCIFEYLSKKQKVA